MNNNSRQEILTSIENASLLRKFTVLFLVMSLIPMIVLAYLYYQMQALGSIQLSADQLNVTLVFVFGGVIVGYIAMRNIIVELIRLTLANKKVLESVLSPEKIKELSYEKNELAILAHSFEAITSRLQESVHSLEIARKTINHVMSKVGQGISNLRNIDSFLELILETITNGLFGRVGIIFLLNPDGDAVLIKTIYGAEIEARNIAEIPLLDNSEIRNILYSKSSTVRSERFEDFNNFKKQGYLFPTPMACAPLIVQEKVLGFIAVCGRKIQKNFEEDELYLLFSLAIQTAVAIQNSQLNKDIESTYFETISALALAVDAKDQYSRGHLDRVSEYTVKLGEKMGLEAADIKTLRDAARLHDLGKIGIPDEVLCKPGALTDHEWLLMRKHPEIGESIISPVASLNYLCDLIRHHHEKLDGSGYPDGLKGDEISQLTRILAIADIYDAVTTTRSYRSEFTPKKAIEMLREMDKQIDQSIVDVLVDILRDEGEDVE